LKTEWDYSDRAFTYDKRADYSHKAIEKIIDRTNCSPEDHVADIGAGTGKLTKLLVDHSLIVKAVEPNDNMRKYGEKNTKGTNVVWTEGVGEATGLQTSSVYAVFYGSSFNVMDQDKALKEAARILRPTGWLVCMWNHRDLTDMLQKRIENIIHEFIPDFDYGKRREDPSNVIESSGHFGATKNIQDKFIVNMEKEAIIDAWKSHDTLYRQSGNKFDKIIGAIAEELTSQSYNVPYFTRIWFSKLK
jgi:ubiquinone/menaquinone biosynthesis C-methylase UbiE